MAALKFCFTGEAPEENYAVNFGGSVTVRNYNDVSASAAHTIAGKLTVEEVLTLRRRHEHFGNFTLNNAEVGSLMVGGYRRLQVHSFLQTGSFSDGLPLHIRPLGVLEIVDLNITGATSENPLALAAHAEMRAVGAVN